MQSFLADIPHFCIFFHRCQYGSSRRKFTLLVHNVPTFQELESRCDNQHAHEPWGQTATGWATAEETAYPWELCRAICHQACFLFTEIRHSVHHSCLCYSNSPAPTNPTTNRRATCFQIIAASPLVSEFASVRTISAETLVPSNARLLALHLWGTSRVKDVRL